MIQIDNKTSKRILIRSLEEFDVLFHTGCNRLIASAKELISRFKTVAPNNSDLRKIDICRVNIESILPFLREGNLFYRSHLFILSIANSNNFSKRVISRTFVSDKTSEYNKAARAAEFSLYAVCFSRGRISYNISVILFYVPK